MTFEEFIIIPLKINAIWNTKLDEFKQKEWYSHLRHLKIKRLISAIDELAKELKFSPSIAEIINKYDDLRVSEMQATKIVLMDKQNKSFKGLNYCDLCKNNGVLTIPYQEQEYCKYEYLVRCICPRGKNLNRYTRYQVNKDMKYLDPSTKREESYYIKQLDDVYTDEQIAELTSVIMARKGSTREGVNAINFSAWIKPAEQT